MTRNITVYQTGVHTCHPTVFLPSVQPNLGSSPFPLVKSLLEGALRSDYLCPTMYANGNGWTPPQHPPARTNTHVSGHWHKGYRERACNRAGSDALGVIAKQPRHEGQPRGGRVPETVLGVHPAYRRVEDEHLPADPRDCDEAVPVR